MTKTLLSCFIFLLSMPLLATATSDSGVHEKQPYTFVIDKTKYKTAEIYQIKSPANSTYPGSVKKSSFRIRTNYDLSNKNGWQATGITRAISLGSLYAWATDIDIYDTRGTQIGLIDGDFATLASARFNLYEYGDAGGKLVGIAFANAEFNQFIIQESISDPRPLAELHRNYNDQTWTVSVEDPDKIDDRLIRIFAGFVIDYQDKFLTSSKN